MVEHFHGLLAFKLLRRRK